MAKGGIPTISLFSGAGGLDLGFISAGYDIKACVEIEPSYCETLKANVRKRDAYHAGTVIKCEDVRAFDTTPFQNAGIRCVIGGPPCQTFSAAGRRAGGVIGTEDERGQLFQAYCRILDELKPEVFVFENVYGLPGANGGGPWREIIGAFSKLGYEIRADVLDAADYGVPQHRERLIMVGHRTGVFRFPLPTHGPDSLGTPLVSVEQAISDLQDQHEPFHGGIGGLYGDLLPLVPEGLNYAFFTAEMGHPEPQFAWRSKFHDLLYKVNRSEPCRTIKAQPGKFTGPFHWKNRHFTVDELKRLQTFPDNYKLVGSYPKVVEQIGNSVPPRLSRAIALSVREQLLEPTLPLELPLRPDNFRSTFRQRQRSRSRRFEEIAHQAIAQQFGSFRSLMSVGKSSELIDKYVLNPQTLFDRTQYPQKSKIDRSAPIYNISVSVSGSHINVGFRANGALGRAEVNIGGLRKYMPGYDTLTLEGRISHPEDIFHAWGAIETALTQRSRFFTLIDIYGHYANRGDTVNISAFWELNCKPSVLRALNFLSASEVCGDFLDELDVRKALSIRPNELPGVVESLRDIRFDFRTSETHPIIGNGRIICTYPFPLLSPRALVESRAQLRKPQLSQELLIAAQ